MSSVKDLKAPEGWEGLDLDSPAYDKLRTQQNEQGQALANKYHQVFIQNELGFEVLSEMMKQTIFSPIQGGREPEYLARRTGQNDIVLQILQNCELAEKD